MLNVYVLQQSKNGWNAAACGHDSQELPYVELNWTEVEVQKIVMRQALKVSPKPKTDIFTWLNLYLCFIHYDRCGYIM